MTVTLMRPAQILKDRIVVAAIMVFMEMEQTVLVWSDSILYHYDKYI